jgi:hypothetical protein
MPHTHATVLGRRVLLDDWLGFHRDRLLATLYQMRDASGDDNGLTLEQIANVTGLDRDCVAALVQSMANEKPVLIKIAPPNVYLLTPRGVRWVEESPSQ